MPRTCVPVDDEGFIKSADDWVNLRRSKEHSVDSSCFSSIAVLDSALTMSSENESPFMLRPADIVMGERTRESKYNAGNVYYRQLVEEKAPEYNAAESKQVKSQLREYVIMKLRERGGRFMNRKGGQGWREMKDEVYIRKRVNQAFRNYRQRTEELTE